jgi:hypothetical protein
MSLPTPYGNASKEIAPLLKGVPLPRVVINGEFICYRIFVDKRLAYEGPVLPVKGFPETQVIVYARHRDSVKCFFTLENWRKNKADIVWQSIALPIHIVQKNVRMKVVIPGVKAGAAGKQVVPAAVKIARRRVDAIRKGRIPHSKTFPRSSTIRPSSESIPRTYTEVTEGNNGGYFLVNTPRSYTGYQRDWSGVRTPGFGKLKRTQLPVNPHTVSISETLDGPGALLSFIPSTGIFFNRFRAYTSDYPTPPSISHNTYAEFKALRKLIERAESGIEGNIAQDIAQIGQTTRLITNTCKRLVKSITALKKGNIPGAVDALWRGHMPRYHGKGPSIGKSLASNWLELQYGWKPLIQDVKASMDALKRLNDTSSPLVRRVTASAKVKTNSASPILSQFSNPSNRIGTHNVDSFTSVKFVLRYKIDDRFKAFLAQTGFTNPINLVWEIVPFSFVVDWFIPIGPYLETLSSWDGLVFLDGSKTTFTRGTVFSVVNATETFANINYEHRNSFRRQVVLLNRVKLTSFPTTKLPQGLKNGLASVTHATNALALLRAAFKR